MEKMMEDFCGGRFWNLDLTWANTGDTTPDFTPCFEQTVLTWIPCIFLWLFAGLDVYYAVGSGLKNIPWTGLNVTKCVVTVILAILQLLLLAYHTFLRDNESITIYPVERYTPIIRILTLCLALFLILFDKIRGVRSSGVQFLFWLLLALCEAFAFRTAILNSSAQEKQEDLFVFVIQMIFYPLIVCQLLLHCWADAEPLYHENPEILERPSPEKGASFLSSLVFFWFETLAWKGYRKPLDYSDLWDLNPEDKSKHLVPIFNEQWNKALGKCKVPEEAKASFRKRSGSIDFKNVPKGDKKCKPQKSLFPTMVKVFGPTFFFGAFMKLLQDLLTFVSPQILRLLIAYVQNDSEAVWKGYFYAILLFAASVVQTLILAQYFHRMFLTGMRMRSTLVGAIYKKALYISNAARKESTVGEIVNLMSVDVQRLQDLTVYINILWSAPLQIILSLYFLWQTLGPSVLAGLGVMVLLIPFNAVIASRIEKLQMSQLKYKDQRVKLMNEILSGIKVLKLYAWEPSFEDQVTKIRGKEIKVLKRSALFNAMISFVWTCAPFLVSLVSFATYALSSPDHVLNAEKIFVSLTLFNIIKMPLTILPMMVMFSIQGKVSLARLNKYMNAEEIDPDAVSHDTQEPDPIVVENGTFAWDTENVTLRNINLRVKEGSLVAVVGTVGSGKSTLLSAILGELEKQSGRVNTKGSIAYVAQQAWIQNATLKENILFGRPLDSAKYEKVIDSCALKPDFEILPAGDQTEIGEKGINLSGGQKQRVSLARASYNNSDVYLLDDPLSAVDSHVGKHIFEKVLGPTGLLKRKTRLLVTHGITFLPQVDHIIVMKDGEISEFGTYKELLSKKGAFSDFLLHHIGSTEEEIEDESIIKDLKEVIGKDVETIIARQRSRISESESAGEQSPFRRQISTLSQDSGEKPSPMRKMSKVRDAEEKVSLLKPDDKLIEVEKAETGSVKFGVYSHYMRAIGVPMTVCTILLHLVFQGFSVISNVWLSTWSSEPVVNGTQDASQTRMYLGVYAGLGLGQALAVVAAAVVMAYGTLRASFTLHLEMLQHILKSPMSFFDTTPIGRIVNRFAKDVDVSDNQLPQNMRSFLSCFLEVMATLFVISFTTPIFISVIIPTGILYFAVQRFYVATSRQLKRLESVSRSPIYSHFGETLTGASTIRAYSMQDRFTLESELKVDKNQIAYYPSIICNRWLAVRLETVGNLIIFFAALFAVIGGRDMDPGLVGLSITYALQITQTLNWLVRMSSDVETNIVAVERIKEYGETPQEAPWQIEGRKPPKSWPEAGAVVFEHFQSRYREGLELVLRDVTCSINPSEKIGIVGRTGAGKSSLTLGLFRIVEAAGGSIVIDGQNISKMGLHDLRGRLTIIPQDPVLFSGSLRINLDPFHSYSDEVVWRALELSHLKSFVKGLSAGLEHEVSEGGENLSVGQRQLICLARALLRKTKILVLDEATAAVDLETDDLIQQTIRTEFKDSTVLTIAHRLNTIMDSTRVMVLDKGEIREFDTPTTLLQNKQSIFYGMAKDAGLV